MNARFFETKKFLLIIVCTVLPLILFSKEYDTSILEKEFNLAGKKAEKTQYYIMESQLISYALDGTRVGRDCFMLYLKWTHKKATDEYTCSKFEINYGDSLVVELPSLANWNFSVSQGIDEKNQVLGIDHSKFANLSDNRGQQVPMDKQYHVYNAFIDFFSFCAIFAEPIDGGRSIADLNMVGQKIIHAAAFTEPPTHLGEELAEGSYFKNGEISLTFKGLSLIKENPCAIIGYDSGESSFKMIATPAPDMKFITVGSSHYQGDIYKDLQTNWVQRVTLHEMVITETALPMPPHKVNSAIERIILVQNVSKEEFEEAK
jgi:hypothetical protein